MLLPVRIRIMAVDDNDIDHAPPRQTLRLRRQRAQSPGFALRSLHLWQQRGEENGRLPLDGERTRDTYEGVKFHGYRAGFEAQYLALDKDAEASRSHYRISSYEFGG